MQVHFVTPDGRIQTLDQVRDYKFPELRLPRRRRLILTGYVRAVSSGLLLHRKAVKLTARFRGRNLIAPSRASGIRGVSPVNFVRFPRWTRRRLQPPNLDP
jgi:hypothetical protein